jgi:tRNA A-37 threonylcarbamoyl transferase component Bud32
VRARLGRYELLRLLARGGMAEVYLARRMGASSVEKRLVLKRILPERARDPRFVELFVNEARLSMSLAHANIVPVFDFGRVDDELFLVMEHVPGADLGALLQRAAAAGRPLDPVLVAAIGAAACEGLDYAHRRTDAGGKPLGIVHRDVTPRNLLISRAGEVKLVDFGVASLGGDPSGRVRGTPAYMAPEQARGESVDARADLYALGLVLNEALSGIKARPGDTTAALAAAARGEAPPLPDAVPPELAGAIRRSLAAAPGERWPDAAEMGRALDAFVVAARASRPDEGPPARRLAAWLAALVPDGDDDAARSGSLAAAAHAPGEATVRSVAETLAEAEEARPAPPAPAPPRRARWILVPLAAVAVAAAVWALRRAPALPPMARDVDAAVATPDARPPVDAPRAHDAPPVATPDAAPAPKMAPPPPRRYPVVINSKPWAKVFIDGKYVDDTPVEVSLPAGRHRVRLENPHDGTHKEVIVDVPRDRRVIETLP